MRPRHGAPDVGADGGAEAGKCARPGRCGAGGVAEDGEGGLDRRTIRGSARKCPDGNIREIGMATEEKPPRGASGIAKLMALMCFEDSRLGRL